MCIVSTIMVNEAISASQWLKQQEETVVLSAGPVIKLLLFPSAKKWLWNSVQCAVCSSKYKTGHAPFCCVLLVSIVVSIPACHAGDRGSSPRRGGTIFHFQRHNSNFSYVFRHIHRQFTSCIEGWSTLPQWFFHTVPVGPVWEHTPRPERRHGWLNCSSAFSPAGRRLCSSGGLFPTQPSQ